ncbi:MAG: TolC family protein [Gammaproteobacteria bacterium]|nr:TolC family protein [Gammaproteobacteria bacterium]
MRKILCFFILSLCFFDIANADINGKKLLSLDEAILLAVRSNPNVQSSQLSYVAQKFSLWVQEWQFFPHYALQASAAYNRNKSSNQFTINSQNYNVQPSVSLITPIGTQVVLAGTNTSATHYNPGLSLQVMQPLMRGFGTAIVEASLNNAKDSTVISQLNIEGMLRSTVTDVINAYLGVVSAERTVLIDEDAVKRSEKSVEQTKLFIKAGHKAGNELVTVEANVASAKTQLENDKNNLIQSRYALLAAIGIDPNMDIQFSNLDVQSLINKYHLPTLSNAKKWTLENDIQYQTDKITLHGQKSRDLLVAEDNTRWQLNFSTNVSTGNGSGGGQNAGFNSLFNGANQTQSVGLTLQIPIDDQQSKQAVVNAKIALKQAELALMQEKWSKETGAINAWNTVISRVLHFYEDAELLRKTHHVSYQKYSHGLIDSLELQSAQQSLIQAQQALLSARINYLRGLVNLDLLIGNTLKTWKINVRL